MRCCKNNVLRKSGAHFGYAQFRKLTTCAVESGSQVLWHLPVCDTVDVPEPAESALQSEGERALVPGVSEDFSVLDTVTPRDTQEVSQAAHVECVELFFFFSLE